MIKVVGRIRKGQIFVVVLITVLFLAVTIPVLIYLFEREAVWSVSHQKRTTAFHLAEAGIERALWKLREKQSNWDWIVSTGPLSGHNNDVIYSDVGAGFYRVVISSVTRYQFKIVATAKDVIGREFRAIEVIVERRDAPSSVFATSVNVSGSAKIFWGPLMSLGNMELQGSASELYPRKMARGSITRTGGPVSYRNPCCQDSDPGGLNTDGLEWWSYNSYPVPDPSVIDTEAYKTQAQSQGLYYTTNQTIPNLVDTNNSAVRYFDRCNAKFTGSKHFRGVVIVDGGDLEFSGSGDSATGSYTVQVSSEAWKEYQKNTPEEGDLCVIGPWGGGGSGKPHDGNYANGDDSEGDKDCRHQYPGDEGYHQAGLYNFNSGCVLHGNSGGAPTEPISFKGFIYVKGGNISASGSVSIHGAIQVDQGGSWSSGSFTIFYDPTLELKLINTRFSQISWREIGPLEF